MTLNISCGSNLIRRKTDARFNSYLKQLPMTHRTPIVFGDTGNKNWAGVCNKYKAAKYREIVISEKYWKKMTNNQRLELLAHELGHCDYDLDHNTLRLNLCPASIMYPKVFGGSCFTDNFNEYMKLFN